MSKQSQIITQLEQSFAPTQLEVRDDSEAHRGHAGYQEGGESHYHVTIRSAAFDGLSRLQRHRAVHSALGANLVASIHALSLDIAV